MQYRKQKNTTAPDFGAFGIGMAIVSLFVWFFLHEIKKSQSGPIPSYILCFILIALFLILSLRSLIHYSFTEKHLIVRFAGIPINKIYWRSVSSAIYLTKWKENGKIKYKFSPSVMEGHAIFVSLYGCPPFDPTRNSRTEFESLHPRTFKVIFLKKKTAGYFVHLFRACYPELVIDSFS